METFLIIMAVVVLLFYINSCSNKTIRSIESLENEIKSLEKRLNILKTELPTASISKTPVAAPTVKVSEAEKAKEWAKYMPSHAQKKEDEIIKEPAKEEPQIITQPEVKMGPTEQSPVKEVPVIPVIQKEEVIVSPGIQVDKPAAQTEKTALSSEAEKGIRQEQKPPVSAQPTIKPVQEKEKTDFEKFIGENLLSKIGIATLVLGIGYFVKYAIDQNWINEIGRVAIGILLGGAIIAVAHKLKDTYRTFSSILVGGGISVLYITITIAFQDYHIFSQTVSFILLILITCFSVFLSVLYDRKELAIFSLLGGFGSPLMVSSGVGNYIVLFSYFLVLNTGMLILAFKKQWKIVSVTAYVLTQIFLWSWLMISFNNEYAGATCFIVLFYVQFYLLALIDHYKESKNISAFQVFVILSNNLSLFASAIYIFNTYPVDVKGIVTIAIALMNAVPMILLFRDKKIDKRLLYLLIAVVLTFVSLAVPIQLNGSAITMFWAAETVLLLWLWQKSEIRIFKYGFIIIEFLVMLSLLMDWVNFYAQGTEILPIIFNKPFITGAVITASIWINAWLLKKEGNKEFLPGWASSVIRQTISFVGIILLFSTLLLELQYQMARFYEPQIFRFSIYGLYCYLFAGVLTLIRWNKAHWRNALYAGLSILIVLYVLIYSNVIFQVRGEVLFGNQIGWGYFSMHYLALPAIILYLIFILRKKDHVIKDEAPQNLMYWFAAISSVIILSLEADNILLMCLYDGSNQAYLLDTSHNIVYPILWGIASFILMVVGMKKKDRTLRMISLTLFVLIIAKLYLYDVWKMEQTGRIIAFIFLGCLFLLVSFLYQKLKILLMKESIENKEKEENASKEIKDDENKEQLQS